MAFAHGDHAGFDDLLIGKAGDLQNVTRIVNVDMSDEIRYTPNSIAVTRNETIRFVITNNDKGTHEFVLGTARRLKEHNERVKNNPTTNQDAPYRISLAPGATGEIVWKFS